MSAEHSTPPAPTDKPPKPAKPEKPSKPYPEFPLTAHPAGYWCKKIRGRIHYFGPWNDWQGALAKYQGHADALHSSMQPPATRSAERHTRGGYPLARS